MVSRVAALAHDRGEHVVGQLEAFLPAAFVDANQSASDQLVDVGFGEAGQLQGVVDGDAVAVAGHRQQAILDEDARRFPEAAQTALVEVVQDRRRVLGQQVGRDARQAAVDSPAVELGTHQTEQRRLDGDLFDRPVRLTRDEADDAGGHLLVEQAPSRAQDRLHGAGSPEPLEPHAIVGGRGNLQAQAFQVGEEILAQAQNDLAELPVVDVARRFRRSLVEPALERGRRPALDEIAQLIEEVLAPGAQRGAFRAEREDLLELVEDQNRHDDAVVLAPQLRVAAIKVLPRRVAALGGRDLDVGFGRRALHFAHDLDEGIRRLRRVVDADIDGQKPFAAQKGEDAGAQQRRLAQAREPEEDDGRRPPHHGEQSRGLGLAAVKIRLVPLPEGLETRPRVLRIESRGFRGNVLPHVKPASAF